MAIVVGNKYFAKRSLWDVAEVDGTIRIIQYSESNIDDKQYRAIVTKLEINLEIERIDLNYKIEELKGTLWVEAFGKQPKISSGTQNEFVDLATGEVVDSATAKNDDGSFKEGYNTSYYHVMITLGLRDMLSGLADSFVEMNLNTKELPKYYNAV